MTDQMNDAVSRSLLALPDRIAKRLPHLRQTDITVIAIAVQEVIGKMTGAQDQSRSISTEATN